MEIREGKHQFAFIGEKSRGFGFNVTYDGSQLTCKSTFQATSLAIAVCLLFGFLIPYGLFFNGEASSWDKLPWLFRIISLLLFACCWIGLYYQLFFHPKIVFDTVTGELMFYKQNSPFRTIHKNEIKDLDIQTVDRWTTSNGVTYRWIGYIVYAQLIDGSQVFLTETSEQQAAEDLLQKIKGYYWRA